MGGTAATYGGEWKWLVSRERGLPLTTAVARREVLSDVRLGTQRFLVGWLVGWLVR